MKKFGFPFIFVFFSMLPVNMPVLSYEDISEEVIEAVSNGNSRELARHFGTNIDLAIPGNEGTFSKAQAELIMRNFFSENRPVSFTVNHQGASRDGSLYVIGTYETTRNRSFRTYLLIKKVSDNFFIHQVQFELQ